MPLRESGEQGVAVELLLVHRHEPGGLYVLGRLTSSTAVARKHELLLDFGAAGGMDGRGVIPNLLPRRRMRQGAVETQPAAVIDGIKHLLRALVELAQLGLPLGGYQLGRLAQPAPVVAPARLV